MQRENAMQRENIEAIYPLLEMQHGFLFNHQLDPQSGSLVVRCELTGALDVRVFQAAWDTVLQRHEMLRCSIHTRDEKPPMLVVWKQVSQPIQVEMDLPSGDQHARDTWLSQLEQRPLALDEAPLGSVHLMPLSDDRHALVWRVHHIVLDGWSAAVVLREVVSIYNQRMQGSTSRLSPPGRYRDYMAYRRARDTDAERSYWQRSMDGFGGMPRLPWSSAAKATAPAPGCFTRELSVEDSARLGELSTDGITPNALAVGCWALVQASLFNTDDVVTGIATAGRAADVAAIESLVGLVANTIPVRTPIPRDENLGEWLRRLRDEQFERQSFEMVSIDDVEAWCQLNSDRVLFESLLVVENFPTSNEETGLGMERFESGIVSAYPLTLCVVPGATWKLKLNFDERRVPQDTAERVLSNVAQRLREVPAGLSEPVGAFTGRTTSSPRMEVNGKGTRASLVGPRTDVQKRLASIWKRVLGRDVGVRSNFFEAGGRSLSAVRMLASVEEEFGQLHSPGVLMQHPTIEALAEVITRDQPSSEIMVRFPSAREGTVIACAHAGGDHAIYYRFLAKRLAGEHPVVAFQSEGLQGGVPQSSIEGLAAANVQDLLDEYPHQPVCLVGYCVGAVVAIEMAGQLERQGHAVRGVIVIDSPVKRDVRNLRDWAHFCSLRPQWLAPVRYGMYHLGLRPLKWALEDLALYTKGSADGRREFYRRRVERATLRAFTRYEPQPVHAPIHLVRSSWRADRSKYDLDVAGWQGLSRSGFTHETLPADHEQMLLEPAVEQLAARVRQRLSAAAPRTVPVTP